MLEGLRGLLSTVKFLGKFAIIFYFVSIDKRPENGISTKLGQYVESGVDL